MQELHGLRVSCCIYASSLLSVVATDITKIFIVAKSRKHRPRREPEHRGACYKGFNSLSLVKRVMVPMEIPIARPTSSPKPETSHVEVNVSTLPPANFLANR
ncbi:uncharacterized protein BDR25DRAFT_353877 [Lindgomyces ingoldianus]|uniref:Uncharacterized protein n=1 Tax=Lindgomyces ingoldianus TaxID=673940 RepID=A0ACB6QYS5_9PLEO|nr:uncharacterized protein BDR25DRAFT_353877 [Lindgomyces ingoldianus]KAF2472153.1 hypothetical protein BDR25DRAFT_353877 [Lindgomyces ingoldianus]